MFPFPVQRCRRLEYDEFNVAVGCGRGNASDLSVCLSVCQRQPTALSECRVLVGTSGLHMRAAAYSEPAPDPPPPSSVDPLPFSIALESFVIGVPIQ